MKNNEGVKLWNKAKLLIPGGNQLLSKRSEMFLPDLWPSYYKKAKGVEIWDLDNNNYIDMSIMGVGTCILGYADDDVNYAVKEAIDNGSMSTLNCYEEVELAEILLDLHSWADMVRYARTGGEAMSLAIRIARTYTNKDKIAFCGYHGWHDWYLSANLDNDTNLDGQLLPGLKPSGVPRNLTGNSLPFNYNKIEELEEIMNNNNDLGTIVVEPVRHDPPEKGFLENIREIAYDNDAVLIFDEITSGFRMNIGGIHNLYNVYPDIAVYGKAMSNGYPMAAIIGKHDVMNASQDSFISSTYWTERIGPTAAIATINKMKEKKVPKHLIKIGDIISQGWKDLAKKNNLDITVMGLSPLTTFVFEYKYDNQALNTLFTQEMLKRGFLASKSIYVSYSHSLEHVNKYFKNLDEIFGIIRTAIDEKNVYDLLDGPVAHQGFNRLN
jgi:glutamate-1-semialdehyde 2,1-aminomutase